MIRTQIQLSEDQAARLKSAAARRGVSIAELIRQGVEAILAYETGPSREELARRAAYAAGRFRSGLHEVAARHDDYLGGAFSH
jgi:plasmid stability protein